MLFHKGETIKLLNDWIEKAQISELPSFFRHVTALCLSEVCQPSLLRFSGIIIICYASLNIE